MKKAMAMLAVVVLMCSSSWGVSSIGPPSAGLNKGQLGLGYNIGLSEMDVDTDLGSIDDVDVDTHLGKLSYGVTDDLEIYGLAGISEIDSSPFSSSEDCAYGFGAKLNLLKQEKFSIAAAYQMVWIEGDDNIAIGGEGQRTIGVSVDAYSSTLAIGPHLELSDNLSIYGGALAYMLDGEIKGGSITTDIDDDIKYGGYAGAQLAINDNIAFSFEYHQLEDGELFGGGVVIKF